jgi:PiT family inorganic phosphate transporter
MHDVLLVFVIIVALTFDFINGFHDTANSIATSVSTRVLSPRAAIIMSSTLNFVGALVSVKVAHTISTGIVSVSLEQTIITAGVIGAIVWDIVTWYFGIPTSSSHALIGSLIGAAIVAEGGAHVILWSNVFDKIIVPLFTSPLIGFAIGYAVMKVLFLTLRRFSQKSVNKWFSKFQIVSAAVMAYSHGSNDAQKTMGIITMALISAGLLSASDGIPLLVKLVCALAMAAGTSFGGWRIIKTIGINMIKLQPVGGFAAETSAATVIQVMTFFGAPVSTTHVISSAIMGVGASKRFSAVRWNIATNILATWLLTIPAAAVIGALTAFVVKLIF